MSSKTTNFNLHKIDLTDAPPDITVLNQNWDIIDGLTAEDFGAAKEAQHQWESYSTLAQISSDLTTDSTPFEVASAMKDYSVLCVVTGGSLSYSGGLIPAAENGVLTIKKTTIARVAFEFVGETTGLYYAYLRSNESAFSGWKQVYSEKDDSVVRKEGDTMNGNLIIKTESPCLSLVDSQIEQNQTYSEIRKNASADVDYGTYISDVSGGTKDMLVLARANELDQKLLLRVESEDGSTNTKYKVYGTHNTHIDYKTYYALGDIGLTVGSETISDIATNLPNYSILIHGVTTENASIYPSNYGLLTVKRAFNSRIEFNFTTTAGKSYKAFYSINSSGDVWTGWKELAFADDAGGVKIATGSYTGTGKAGSGNPPNTVTFPFTPTVVWLKKTGPIYFGVATTFNSVSSSQGECPITYSGNTMSWYNSNGYADYQYNSSGTKYYWVAIG